VIESGKKKPPIPIPPWKKADAHALQALERGEASSDEQKRALAWIINNACGTYDFCVTPEIERLAAIFDGRRFAGLQIIKLIKLNLSRMKDDEQ
jgi:hypothetical protein